MPQSVKQKWVFERLFRHKGTLLGTYTQLRAISRSSSTLASESLTLELICKKIKEILELWDNEEVKERSFTLFEKHNKP